VRLVVLILFAAIIVSLGFALKGLFRRDAQPKQMVGALTLRIALSVLAFALLMLAWYTGLLEPHDLAP
jgi:hypothetical protein